MGTRIFRMLRRRIERLPRRIDLGVRVPVDIAVAYRRDRAPEFVVILGVEHRDVRIGQGCGKRRQYCPLAKGAELFAERWTPTRVVRPDPVELNMQAPLDC